MRRPVANDMRLESVRRVAPQVTVQVRLGGKRRTVPSSFAEIFDLAVETGRRLSAIRQLRYADLRLDKGPHGSIHWPSTTDKMGHEATIPLTPIGRAAIDRVMAERPGIGSGYLFPSPADPSKPVSRHLCDKWLRKAEQIAGIEPQDGSLWHAYRRRWATVRKNLPAQDVARAGGWAWVGVVQEIYTQADEATILEVVLSEGTLREARKE